MNCVPCPYTAVYHVALDTCPAPTGPVRIERRPVRIGNAFPRLPRRFAPRNDTSGGYCGAPAPSSGLIPLCKALNERRYRRNRSVRFYRHLVRTGSAFPRLPRPLWGLAMTRQGSAAMGTVRHTASAVLLPLRGRAWLSVQCSKIVYRCAKTRYTVLR